MVLFSKWEIFAISTLSQKKREYYPSTKISTFTAPYRNNQENMASCQLKKLCKEKSESQTFQILLKSKSYRINLQIFRIIQRGVLMSLQAIHMYLLLAYTLLASPVSSSCCSYHAVKRKMMCLRNRQLHI